MNKKTNTFIFILGATVFNILTTIISFILLVFIFTRIITAVGADSEAVMQWGILIVFIGAIVLSFVLYRVVIKQISKKYDLDKYFAPLFGPRRPPRKRTD